jgi:hypothetical protein
MHVLDIGGGRGINLDQVTEFSLVRVPEKILAHFKFVTQNKLIVFTNEEWELKYHAIFNVEPADSDSGDGQDVLQELAAHFPEMFKNDEEEGDDENN